VDVLAPAPAVIATVPAIVLSTARLHLRPFAPADLNALQEIYRDPSMTQYLYNGAPWDYARIRLEMTRFLKPHDRPDYAPLAVIERATGKLIGDAGLMGWSISGVPEVELSYTIRQDRWGRGYATEAAGAVRDWAYSTLGLTRLVALIRPENAPSIRIALKLGFLREKTIELRGQRQLMYAHSRNSLNGA